MQEFFQEFEVTSDNVRYSPDLIEATYQYTTTEIRKVSSKKCVLEPKVQQYAFKTERRVPKTGLLMVGWGGNNGTTVTAGILANRHRISWHSARGKLVEPNYLGSMTQCSTVRLGSMGGNDVNVPFKSLLPMVDPSDLVLGGWDISKHNMKEAMFRSQVIDWDLQRQLGEEMAKMVPMPGVFNEDFVAPNQKERADNVLTGSLHEQVEQLRQNIRDFKAAHSLEKLVIMWTANTEKRVDIIPGINDTEEAVLRSIRENRTGLAPSSLYAVASILEKVPFINGSPQNTFVPGVLELAISHQSLIAGDDFKSGQTKLKSVLVEFLINAGIKPKSIASYNHLGNNDGMNLSCNSCFESKEKTKSGVISDMVQSNPLLYPDGQGPDHCIVIKYIPHVGDSKRAIDEYTSEIFLNGTNTMAIHNTCEDSLLAAPLILDMVILMELMSRIQFKAETSEAGAENAYPNVARTHPSDTLDSKFSRVFPVVSLLSYWSKAPLVGSHVPLVNALSRQRAAIENFLRACVGLTPENNMDLEAR